MTSCDRIMKKIIKWVLFVAAAAVLGSTAYFTAGVDVYATWWALMPPLLAIVLALITKEVYSSLFAGIVYGAL